MDEGEAAEATALREVVEESGRRPKTVEHVVTYQPMVGMVDSPHEIVAGHVAERVGQRIHASKAAYPTGTCSRPLPTERA